MTGAFCWPAHGRKPGTKRDILARLVREMQLYGKKRLTGDASWAFLAKEFRRTPLWGLAQPDRTMMTLAALIRLDLERRTTCDAGLGMSGRTLISTTMTITMTTSGTRGQVGVD